MDKTERLHFHFSLSRIGEGNGNPLQCSCLENPRDGEPGGLPSVGSHRVGHDWSDLVAAAYRNKIHSFLPNSEKLACMVKINDNKRKKETSVIVKVMVLMLFS